MSTTAASPSMTTTTTTTTTTDSSMTTTTTTYTTTTTTTTTTTVTTTTTTMGVVECCSGCICSPNYPSNYGNSLDIEYVMTAPAGETITVTFLAFKVEFQSSCNYDWVQIFEGTGTTGTELLSKACGTNTIPSPVTSTTNTATLLFHTDSSETEMGFVAQLSAGVTFTMPSTTAAPSTTTTTSSSTGCCSGCICSPDWPANYPLNTEIEYV